MAKIGRPLGDIMERFYAYIDISDDGCWQWHGEITRLGYGRFFYNYTRWLAHRFSYFVFKGDFKEGMVLDHLCRNRACVNPDHLEEVTVKENTNRGIQAEVTRQRHLLNRKYVCKKGHSVTGENLIERKGKYGTDNGIRCRKCQNDYLKEYTKKRKELKNAA